MMTTISRRKALIWLWVSMFWICIGVFFIIDSLNRESTWEVVTWIIIVLLFVSDFKKYGRIVKWYSVQKEANRG